MTEATLPEVREHPNAIMRAVVRSGVGVDIDTIADRLADHADIFRFRTGPDLKRAGDYCSLSGNAWLWSIARSPTGVFYASTIERFPWPADYERLWDKE